MQGSEKDQILEVLVGAIARETSAFNYYYRGSEDPSMPTGVRGLLARLAEEERRHRHLLMNEYMALKKGWSDEAVASEEQSLAYALPDELPFIPLKLSSDLEAVALSLPSRLVGGDNIFSSVVVDRSGRERGTIIILYDVMGHGIETTEINALAAKIVGEYVESSSSVKMEVEWLSPSWVVRLLNQRLNEQYEGQGVFLTMLCAFFDSENRTLSYTLAGHEPPFIIRDEGRVGSLLNTQLVVGIDPAYHYREHKVTFDEGDAFCVFSDGIIEAENENGEIFGRKGVSAILEESWKESLDEIARRLLKGMDEHTSGALIKDEISIVIVKAKGAL